MRSKRREASLSRFWPCAVRAPKNAAPRSVINATVTATLPPNVMPVTNVTARPMVRRQKNAFITTPSDWQHRQSSSSNRTSLARRSLLRPILWREVTPASCQEHVRWRGTSPRTADRQGRTRRVSLLDSSCSLLRGCGWYERCMRWSASMCTQRGWQLLRWRPDDRRPWYWSWAFLPLSRRQSRSDGFYNREEHLVVSIRYDPETKRQYLY